MRRGSGLPPQRLEIEITEAVSLRNTDAVAQVLRAVHAHGVQVALDDFGTGYAPLSHLKDLPCQVLKIDRSFVRTLAEGVETAEAEALLRELGCSRLQGYRLSRPLEALALGQLLRRQVDQA